MVDAYDWLASFNVGSQRNGKHGYHQTFHVCDVVLFPMFFSARDTYPIGLTVLSGCFCRVKLPACASEASVPRRICLLKFRSARIIGVMREPLSAFSAAGSSGLRDPNAARWSFRKRLFNGAEICSRSRTKLQKTLHNLGKVWSFVEDVKALIP